MRDDERAELFRAWVAQHQGTVFKVARAYTQTNEDCQDLVQEILYQAWLSLARFEGRSSAATWLYRVALNTALSWQRDERRQRARRETVVQVEDLATCRGSGDESAAEQELVARLYDAIQALPKAESALVLMYLDGLSYREMGEVLGISENHVGVKLSRARKALSEKLNPLGSEENGR